MRKAVVFLASAALAVVLAGCGGSGGGAGVAANSVTRMLVGFVYVKNNAGLGTGPDAIIAPTTTPPTGYFKPTAGTVTLSVTDGTIVGRAPGQYTRDMADGNDIIVTASAKDTAPDVSITASNLELSGTSKTFAAYSEDLGTVANNGTTLAMGSPGFDTTTYTPGPPAAIEMRVRGLAPETALPDGLISGDTYSIAVAVFDVNGVAITGASPTVSSDLAAVAVNGSSTLLTPSVGAGDAEAPVVITASLTGSSLTESFNSDFNYGDVTSITVNNSGSSSLTWATAGAPATINGVTATVKNQFNAPMPNQSVQWSNAKAPSNTWDTTTGGSCFSAASGNSDASGVVTVNISAPVSVAGPLSGADKNPKGTNSLVATVGSTSGNTQINVVRPLNNLVITGPNRVDVGTFSASSGAQAYSVTGAEDVDNDAMPIPAGSVVWSRTNVAGVGVVGNTGNTTTKTTANSSINSSTGVLDAGSIAGEVDVVATIGSVSSAAYRTQIYGIPTKVFFNPDTNGSVVDGSSGEYAGPTGGNQPFGVEVMDSYGHIISWSEMPGYTTSASIDSITVGSITSGGTGVSDFTVTFGNFDGLFTIGVNGTWVGAQGGGGAVNITRATGANCN